MITSLIGSISNKKYQHIAFLLVELLVISPIIMMILNALPLTANQVYCLWYTITYFVGDFGLLVGGILFIRLIKDNLTGFKHGVISLMPLLLLVLFGLWCFLCDCNARFKFISFLSYDTCLDGFFMMVAYFGIVLLGLILSSNRVYLLSVAKTFFVVSMIQTIVSLMNNKVTELFCKNEVTTTDGYESVFYNTNHFGYYLVFSLMVTGCLFIYSKKTVDHIIYAVSLVAMTILLALNNTMGSHLAILLTLVFMLIWACINKDKSKMKISIVLGIFIVSSLITLLFTSNIYDSYLGLFNNLRTLLLGQEITGESLNSIGSGRGFLWKFSFEIAKQNPMLGIGAVNAFLSAHNMFLQMAFQFGFVGLVIYLLMLVTGMVRLIKKRKILGDIQKSSAFCVVAYLISAFFGVTMFYTAPYYYLILGICLSSALKEIDENKIVACFKKS